MAPVGDRAARGPGGAHRRSGKHHDRRASADRVRRWRRVGREADAGQATGDDPGPSRRLGGRCHLSEARRRAHSARHRSSALRARSHPDRTEHAAAHPGDHGFHRCAQHHTRRGNSRLRQCAAATGRGCDRAVDRLRRRRDHPCPRGQGWHRRPRALGRRVRVRAPPRLRLRRGAQRGWAPSR